ncbi:L-threonylcarbamoyladenylate synthase [Candidatus Vallotia cooleyia]|uniref:L-threonylcarbamoyladenylate synthase n=1 Tax=Candidatus Vallotiella adelgis TaxID=1177211 RepID=UPI001D00EF61|nr:L-threonylcarbamoyladenylate synthase [Candidatus Vallotia cooleyia]UDG82464.1 Threonylcarbamoyl-AMP synthase [Candidatus Vallotia cooleyia]
MSAGKRNNEHSTPPSPTAINAAVRHLLAGELVAFPTETVYGLGADARNSQAVARIYATKGRPDTHPVIIHLAPGDDPSIWVRTLDRDARRLIDTFWPGPLTLILKRANTISDLVSGGQDSIGLRCPAHPVAQALLRTFSDLQNGYGIVAAPSANKFGYVSPTTAQHVRDEFHNSVHVLDGGTCDIGIESTIIDLSRGFPVLLRPGRITLQQIASVLGTVPQLPNNIGMMTPRTSGMLKSHYAPRTPLVLLSGEEIPYEVASHASHERLAVIARSGTLPTEILRVRPNLQFVAAPHNPLEYARELYRILRQLDGADLLLILIELLPASAEWVAVNDRLQHAAAAFKVGCLI